jgi:Pentapeptide repeats (9 copies)
MTPEETVKPEEQSTTNKCHVHDKCSDRQNVRKFVCRNLETTLHTDRNHYCLLHQPTNEKNDASGNSRVPEFEDLFNARVHEHDNAIAEIEAGLPDDKDKQNEAKRKQRIRYDFRYVWFATEVDLEAHTFKADTNFSLATFSGNAYFSSAAFGGFAYFSSATFGGSANFSSATFNGSANFSSATISGNTNFSSAIFSGNTNFSSVTFSYSADFSSVDFSSDADFSLATFGSDADFSSATFDSDANFSSATFDGSASFNSANFEETSQTYFIETRFCSVVWFSKAVIEGYVEFEGNIFLEADKVQDVKKQLETKFAELQTELAKREIRFNFPVHFIKDGQEAVFEFRDVRLRNPERVSFNSMQLRPSWFVNVDEARKVAFNDVKWLNTEIDIDRIGLIKERLSLRKRKIRRAKHSLIRAFNQLADNAEANRRFEEAKQFRKQGIALQKRKCYVHFEIDPDKKPDIRIKVCRHYPVVNEDGGRYYCLWHNPDADKSEVFREEFDKQKYTHTDYRGVVFTCNIIFNGNRCLDNLDFHYATFQKQIAFENIVVADLYLRKTYFTEDAELLFKKAHCTGWINLNRATFEGKLNLYKADNYKFFIGTGGLSAIETKFDKPNWITFRNVRLLPEYFFDVDSSRFTFHDCKWIDDNENYLKLNKADDYKRHKQIAQTCNYLAINYEENRHFEESSMFRYASMDSKRLSFIASKKKDWFKRFNLLLYRIYKWTSGYGESWSWAMGVLLAFLIGFWVLFSCPLISTFDYGEQKTAKANDEVEQLIYNTASYGERFRSMTFWDGMVHSLSVATFQRPEPKAYGFWTKLFVALEVIFAPLLAALLALAIRRKFMR